MVVLGLKDTVGCRGSEVKKREREQREANELDEARREIPRSATSAGVPPSRHRYSRAMKDLQEWIYDPTAPLTWSTVYRRSFLAGSQRRRRLLCFPYRLAPFGVLRLAKNPMLWRLRATSGSRGLSSSSTRGETLPRSNALIRHGISTKTNCECVGGAADCITGTMQCLQCRQRRV